jgi:hypothetical protein
MVLLYVTCSKQCKMAFQVGLLNLENSVCDAKDNGAAGAESGRIVRNIFQSSMVTCKAQRIRKYFSV